MKRFIYTAGFAVLKAVYSMLPLSVATEGYDRLKPVKKVTISDPESDEAEIVAKFVCPNRLSAWRAETLFTKEPETIRWLRSMPAGSHLLDIGANIGMYSIFAGLRGVRVTAIEPEALNFGALCQNVVANSLGEFIYPIPIGVGSATELSRLNLPTVKLGSAMNSLGEPLDFEHKPFKPELTHGVMCYRIDDLVSDPQIGIPSHIKIDVDGLEAEVVKGAMETLKSDSVVSILIELNEGLEVDRELITIIEGLGYTQKEKSRSEVVDNDTFSNVFNFVFERK